MCSIANSSKFLPVGSLSRPITISYLLFVGMFGIATASGSRKDNPAHVQMLFQLRVWCLKFINHIKCDDCPDLPVNKAESEVKSKVKENFAANYKHSLMQHSEIFPLLGELADSLDVLEEKPEKRSGWMKTGGKLLGAGIKMVVGISLLQAGTVFECFKDVADVLHGSYEIFGSLRTVGNGIMTNKKRILKALRLFKKNDKKVKMEEREFKVTDKLKEALKTLKDGLDDIKLEMQGEGNQLTDAQCKAIGIFSVKLMTKITAFQIACKEKYTESGENGNHKVCLFYRMVENKLNELHWPYVRCPDVSNIVSMDKVKEELSHQKQETDTLKSLIGDLIRSSAKNRSDLRRLKRYEEREELLYLLESEGCKIDAKLLRDLQKLDDDA